MGDTQLGELTEKEMLDVSLFLQCLVRVDEMIIGSVHTRLDRPGFLYVYAVRGNVKEDNMIHPLPIKREIMIRHEEEVNRVAVVVYSHTKTISPP